MPTAGKGTYRELLRQRGASAAAAGAPAPCDDAATDAFLLLEKGERAEPHQLPLKKDEHYPQAERENTLRCCGGGPPGSRYSISWGIGTLWGGTLR